MASVGVKELKNRLTQYIRRAKAGEDVVVTERGRPVALLTSITSTGSTASLDAKLAKLAALGLVTLPTRKLARRVRRVRVTGTPLSKQIIEDRR